MQWRSNGQTLRTEPKKMVNRSVNKAEKLRKISFVLKIFQFLTKNCHLMLLLTILANNR